jgi:hypothetical protein
VYEFQSILSARTAIGFDENGRIILVVVDGKTKQRGVDLNELADILISQFKVVNAINLDGGGSSTLTLGGDVINIPSDECDRDCPKVGQCFRATCERAITSIVCFHDMEVPSPGGEVNDTNSTNTCNCTVVVHVNATSPSECNNSANSSIYAGALVTADCTHSVVVSSATSASVVLFLTSLCYVCMWCRSKSRASQSQSNSNQARDRMRTSEEAPLSHEINFEEEDDEVELEGHLSPRLHSLSPNRKPKHKHKSEEDEVLDLINQY